MHTEALDRAERRLLLVLRLLDSKGFEFSTKQSRPYQEFVDRFGTALAPARRRFPSPPSRGRRSRLCLRLARVREERGESERVDQEIPSPLLELSSAEVRRELRALLPRVSEQLATVVGTASSKAGLVQAILRATALWASLANYIEAYYQTEAAEDLPAEDLKLVLEAGERLMNAMEERREELWKLRSGGELEELRKLMARRSYDLPWWLND